MSQPSHEDETDALTESPSIKSISPITRLRSGPPSDRIADFVTWGLPALGLIAGARVLAGVGDGPGWLGTTLDALYVAAAHGLAGIVLGGLIRASGERLIPIPTTPAVPATEGKPPVANATDPLAEHAAELRRSIQSRDWGRSADILEDLSRDRPGDPRILSLSDELRDARDSALREHTAQLEAARKVNDPERVIELHRVVVPLLEADARAALEADLSQWFLKLIHRRLRTGKIQADLALLAGRIADSFGHTVEGASLRASLPTLRRSAGLCPRCSQPYMGLADACPSCLAAARHPERPAMPPGPGQDEAPEEEEL